ncbi:MFS transporter [Pseudomonas sp. 7P_10.2_Bac1]|uniref:MFS transporter n=1 Tax=Pseudomonas sp. 7P_10.2_Bac1 TaxID=2971614 RepID=UPI0021CA2477|nr:MFS transporter [Pseudomonas sp. 7P_10.2_Bac1]MCU1728597.1 MFS transporter [Pseudomonas sp. 7P_10.2_Bac1]
MIKESAVLQYSYDDSSQTIQSPWKASIVAGMGSAVEYYDFAIYGLLASTLGKVFFPAMTSFEALLSALAVFASAFIMRPLGGIFFGRLGDRRGRSFTLITTVVGIGIVSGIVGILPTYSQAGVIAPVMLVACRLAQGFFAGGEASGAATYISECAPADRRGFFGAFNPAGVAIGISTAAGMAGIISVLVTPEEMVAWGWRIPFLICIPFIGLTLWARMKLEDSPKFKSLVESNEVVKAPVRELFKNYRKPVVLAVTIAFAQNCTAYLGIVYLNIHMTRTLGYETSKVFWLMAGITLAAALAMPLFGQISDHVGRKRLMIIGYASYVVITPIAMYLMTFGNFILASAACLLAFLPFAIVQAQGYTVYGELFPTRVRYTGMAMSFNVGAIFGGASTPFICAWLVEHTGNSLSPSLWIAFAAMISIVALMNMKDLTRQELTN